VDRLSYPGSPSYIGPQMLRSAFSAGLGFIKPELPTLVPELLPERAGFTRSSMTAIAP